MTGLCQFKTLNKEGRRGWSSEATHRRNTVPSFEEYARKWRPNRTNSDLRNGLSLENCSVDSWLELSLIRMMASEPNSLAKRVELPNDGRSKVSWSSELWPEVIWAVKCTLPW